MISTAADKKRAKATDSTTVPARKLVVPRKTKVSASATVADQPTADVDAITQSHATAKAKLIRDSFTIPKPEYDNLAALKRRALGLGVAAKKGELIRAGIVAMTKLSDAAFLSTLKSVPNLKTGRPKGSAA